MIKKVVTISFGVFCIIIGVIVGTYTGLNLGYDMSVEVRLEYNYSDLKNETLVLPAKVWPGGILLVEFEHLVENATYIIGIPDCMGYNTIVHFKANQTPPLFWIVYSNFDSLWILRKENQDRDEKLIAEIFFEKEN